MDIFDIVSRCAVLPKEDWDLFWGLRLGTTFVFGIKGQKGHETSTFLMSGQ